MQLYYYKVVLCISNSVLQCCKRKPLKAKKNVIEALVDAKCSTIILVADVTMLAFTALLLWTMINFTSMIFPWLSLVHTERLLLHNNGIPCSFHKLQDVMEKR